MFTVDGKQALVARVFVVSVGLLDGWPIRPSPMLSFQRDIDARKSSHVLITQSRLLSCNLEHIYIL